MPKFIIERTVPGASKLTDAEIREASLKSDAWAGNPVDPQLHHGRQDYCIYFSPDEYLIIEHGRLIGLPVDRVEAVRRMVDPTNYASA